MTVASTGTGTITLGSAATINGVLYLSFAAAGVADGETVAYSINDVGGSEAGTGVYTAAGTTLARTPVTSTNSNNAINMTAAAIVKISPAKADLANLREINNFTQAFGVQASAGGLAASAFTVGGTGNSNTDAGFEVVPGAIITFQAFNRNTGAYTRANFDAASFYFRPSATIAFAALTSGCLAVGPSGGDAGSGNITATQGGLSTAAPTTKTANYSMLISDSSLIFNGAGSLTLTLLAAGTYPGRWLTIKTIAAQTVVSATSNVVPLIGGAAGTAILAATAGKWAALQSDGTNWIIMAGN
jgi:hypothetical protein